ncbi:MAG: sigma factor [Victivallaceae bacterium]|nr:sigma factor [Victivallaceae bacterium]
MTREEAEKLILSEAIATDIRSRIALQAPSLSFHDRQDLTQDALILLWKQLPGYDPSRGAPTTFCATVINSAIRAHFRYRSQNKRRALFEAVPLPEQ